MRESEIALPPCIRGSVTERKAGIYGTLNQVEVSDVIYKTIRRANIQ